MTYYVKEKIIGYRISMVQADSLENARKKWLVADGLTTYDVDVLSAEMISIEEREDF